MHGSAAVQSKFCVYLTIYRGNKLPPFYIGSTSVDKINNGYRGSVRSRQYQFIWKEEIKNNSDLFKTVIISLHDTRKEASDKEAKLQSVVNAHLNPLYINKAIWNGTNLNYKGLHTIESRAKSSASHTGKRHSEETKQKIRNSNIGKKKPPMTKAHKEAIRKAQLGKQVSDETRNKLSVALRGKQKGPRSNEVVLKVRNSKIKTKWIIVDPNGNSEEIIFLKEWCDTKGFKISNVRTQFKNYGHYKGYKAEVLSR